MGDVLWAILLIGLAIGAVRFLGGIFTFVLLPVVLLCMPGAYMARNEDARLANPGRYRFGMIYTCVVYNACALIWVAAVAEYSYYMRTDVHSPWWLVWPFGLFLASIPLYHGSKGYWEERMKSRQPELGLEGSPNDALEAAAGIAWFGSYPAYILLALFPSVLLALFGWLPWSRFVHR